MSKTPVATYENFNAENLRGSEPEAGTTTAENGTTVNFYNMKLAYNYGTSTEPIINDVFLELSECLATGIKLKTEEKIGKEKKKYTKTSGSMMIRFDLINPELKDDNQRSIMAVESCHKKCCQFLGKYKGKVKKHEFNPDSPGETFKSPIYWPRDESSGEIIAGRNPSMWVSLKTDKLNKTKFIGLDEKTIDWKLLTDVDITFVPLIHLERIFVGTKTSIKVHLVSAIVTKIAKVNSENKQLSTLDRLKQKLGQQAAENFQAQVAMLQMEKQDEMSSNEMNMNQTTTRNNEDVQGTMHDLGNESDDNQTSLNDFLGGAPSMTSQAQSQTQNQTQAQVQAQQGPPVFNVTPQRMTVQTMRIN